MSAVPPEVLALVDLLPAGFAMTGETVDGRRRGRCIEAVRIATAVLPAAGVACRPMPCDALVYNAAARELVTAGVPLADWPAAAHSLGVAVDGDAYAERGMVPGGRGGALEPGGSLSEPYRRSGWAGHLVTVGDGWLLDLTAGQFARPDRGIVVEDAIAGPLEEASAGVEVDLDEGGILVYRWRPEAARWRRTPAWRQDVRRELVELMVERIRVRLELELEEERLPPSSAPEPLTGRRPPAG